MTTGLDLGVNYHHFRGQGTRKGDETIYAELTRDLASECDVTISVTYVVVILMQMTQYRYIDVDSTIFEAEEIKNDETIYVELARDLESDCDVTIPVTCRYFV